MYLGRLKILNTEKNKLFDHIPNTIGTIILNKSTSFKPTYCPKTNELVRLEQQIISYIFSNNCF